MANEEMQQILEYMMQRQGAFTGQHEKFRESPGRLERNQELLQGEVRGLAGVVRQIGGAQTRLSEAQAQTQKDISQTQTDLSHLARIVNGLAEFVMRDRNGDSQN